MLRVKGNYKRNQNQKLLQGIISEETKIETNRAHHQKAGTGSRMNSGLRCEQCCRMKISQCSIFLHFFALLSFWDLICNDEFDSNSSCLD